jgi:hypothetical protein
MFPQQPQQQFRTAGADVQIFYGAGGVVATNQRSWNKPPGVSHIYMMLIGGGGQGDGTTGGSSGAVTVWYGAAQHVPDSLVVSPARGDSGIHTTVSARFSNSAAAPTALLTAESANNLTVGAAMTANQFTASGFFQSTAGTTSALGATDTFLSAGSVGGGSLPGNYGYSTNLTGTNGSGYFLLQPVIVSLGGAGSGSGGIGSGSGSVGTGTPGRGLVLIASW